MRVLFISKIFGRRNVKGSMYLLTLITLTVLYIMVLVFLQKIYLDIRTLRHAENELRTLYTAHAGLEDVIYELRHPEGSMYFSGAHGWFAAAPPPYNKNLPYGITSPIYQSMYSVETYPLDLSSSDPSTFNVIVNALLTDGPYTYTRRIYAEGAWTKNKEVVYLTKVQLQ